MPPTPLFPRNNQAITITQGRTGDCYILAFLDAILNSEEDISQVIKSMFNLLEDGSIELRIKRNSYSTYLDQKINTSKFQKKYRYKKENGFDVFIISPKRLQEIDNSSEVKTNALAIKIFERITSYYYQKIESTGIELESVYAHNGNNRFAKTVEEFLSELFSIHVTVKTAEDRVYLENLKALFPDYSICIHMNMSEPNDHRYIGYHAYRIKSIRRGEHECIVLDLIDPFKTGKVTSYTWEDILKRKAKFYVYSITKQHQNLVDTVLNIRADEPKDEILLRTMLYSEHYQTIFFKPYIYNGRAANTTLLIRNLMTHLDYKKPEDILTFINKIQKNNPSLGDQLFGEAPNWFPVIFSEQSFFNYVAEIMNTRQTSYQSWLIETTTRLFTITHNHPLYSLNKRITFANSLPKQLQNAISQHQNKKAAVFFQQQKDMLAGIIVSYQDCNTENEILRKEEALLSQAEIKSSVMQVLSTMNQYLDYHTIWDSFIIKQADIRNQAIIARQDILRRNKSPDHHTFLMGQQLHFSREIVQEIFEFFVIASMCSLGILMLTHVIIPPIPALTNLIIGSFMLTLSALYAGNKMGLYGQSFFSERKSSSNINNVNAFSGYTAQSL